MTERYAVIGNPVAHSQSPAIHVRFAQATGQDIAYDRIEAPLDGFERAVDKFRAAGGRGLNVTLPFKQAAFRYCDEVTERARTAQAVNTGGAAQGVVGSLLDAMIARLVVANRTFSRAAELAARFKPAVAARYEDLQGAFDVVINATSAGLGGEPLALPVSVIGKNTLAYDMVYGRDTVFLQAARAAGARRSDGLGMLVEQAAESFFIWRGVRPATRGVLASLRGH